MPLTPSIVGSGRGRQKKRTARKATTGRKEITLASQGFVNEVRSTPFIGGPQACNAPATMMIG